MDEKYVLVHLLVLKSMHIRTGKHEPTIQSKLSAGYISSCILRHITLLIKVYFYAFTIELYIIWYIYYNIIIHQYLIKMEITLQIGSNIYTSHENDADRARRARAFCLIKTVPRRCI